MIVTRSDVGLALHCKYEIKNQTVRHSLNSGIEVKLNPSTEYIEEVVVSSPNVSMRVTTVFGEDVIAAQVGDNLALRSDHLFKCSRCEFLKFVKKNLSD